MPSSPRSSASAFGTRDRILRIGIYRNQGAASGGAGRRRRTCSHETRRRPAVMPEPDKPDTPAPRRGAPARVHRHRGRPPRRRDRPALPRRLGGPGPRLRPQPQIVDAVLNADRIHLATRTAWSCTPCKPERQGAPPAPGTAQRSAGRAERAPAPTYPPYPPAKTHHPMPPRPNIQISSWSAVVILLDKIGRVTVRHADGRRADARQGQSGMRGPREWWRRRARATRGRHRRTARLTDRDPIVRVTLAGRASPAWSCTADRRGARRADRPTAHAEREPLPFPPPPQAAPTRCTCAPGSGAAARADRP
jgi:hypothetical protein